MTPADFVASIPRFTKFNYTEQIKRFCWFLSSHRNKAKFSGADIAKCFDDANCPKPTSVGPFLTSLAKQKPAFLVKQGTGYALSRHAREQLDPVLGQRDATVAVHKLLTDLPAKLTIGYERAYLEEALTCFRHKAYRAAVVMTWNLAYDHFCNFIMSSHLADFNTQLPKSFPKADISSISKRDDFTVLKESQVIQVAKSANIISNSVNKILKEKLDRRNIAAHPSGVSTLQLTAEEFIQDLVENVMLKL
jgi:hypothetical protein